MRILPEDDWILFSHLLIFHGRRTCIARRPNCVECPVVDLCPSGPYFLGGQAPPWERRGAGSKRAAAGRKKAAPAKKKTVTAKKRAAPTKRKSRATKKNAAPARKKAHAPKKGRPAKKRAGAGRRKKPR